MEVYFDKDYLKELYVSGKTSDKHHRYQLDIIRRYKKVVDIMICETNVLQLARYGSLHYEHLHGDKEGMSSVRVNDQYRIEFTEETVDGESIATICTLEELSNHYK